MYHIITPPPPKGFSLTTFDWQKLWKRNFALSKFTPNLTGRCNKISNLDHNFGEREAKSIANSVKLI